MNVMEAIARRKSTRSYREEQITDEVLNTILFAGYAAPVGMAMYDSLHMTVIQDKAVLKNISEGIAKALKLDNDPVYGAPTVVLISAKEEIPAPNLEYVSAGCIVENMMIAATAQEIGSVVLWGTAMVVNADPSLRNTLKIPEGFKPIVSVALGYATAPDLTEKEPKVTILTNRI